MQSSYKTLLNDENALLANLPEVGHLHDIVENNDWHNDSVLWQSLRLLHWVQSLPNTLLEAIDVPEKPLQAWLTTSVDSKPNGHTGQELLIFTALVHDIGKAETYRRQPDGATQCPGHEAAGANLISNICHRLGWFTPAETTWITTLVRFHGSPYALFKKIKPLPEMQQQEQVHRFETEHIAYLQPLLVLAAGDMLTSHLETINPQKHRAVFNFYRRWLLEKPRKPLRFNKGMIG